jgi:hypothetical protein
MKSPLGRRAFLAWGLIAEALRAADVDGEAPASLTDDDTQALGIEPVGRHRRLTLRVADSLGATTGGIAPRSRRAQMPQ